MKATVLGQLKGKRLMRKNLEARRIKATHAV